MVFDKKKKKKSAIAFFNELKVLFIIIHVLGESILFYLFKQLFKIVLSK